MLYRQSIVNCSGLSIPESHPLFIYFLNEKVLKKPQEFLKKRLFFFQGFI